MLELRRRVAQKTHVGNKATSRVSLGTEEGKLEWDELLKDWVAPLPSIGEGSSSVKNAEAHNRAFFDDRLSRNATNKRSVAASARRVALPSQTSSVRECLSTIFMKITIVLIAGAAGYHAIWHLGWPLPLNLLNPYESHVLAGIAEVPWLATSVVVLLISIALLFVGVWGFLLSLGFV